MKLPHGDNFCIWPQVQPRCQQCQGAFSTTSYY
jgi:hypothetical protein